MCENRSAQEEALDQTVELGASLTRTSRGNIYTLTIIGQIEGHQVLPETAKTTKYEHVLPLLAQIEECEDVDGLLLLLNTVGGDIEAGLAIAELIAGMKKPTVSLVLGGGHSIGVPLAVRMSGTVVGAPATFQYFNRIQNHIVDFVAANSHIGKKQFVDFMMATGELATDVGTVLYGREAVKCGLIDELGSLSGALDALHEMIRQQKEQRSSGQSEKSSGN